MESKQVRHKTLESPAWKGSPQWRQTFGKTTSIKNMGEIPGLLDERHFIDFLMAGHIGGDQVNAGSHQGSIHVFPIPLQAGVARVFVINAHIHVLMEQLFNKRPRE